MTKSIFGEDLINLIQKTNRISIVEQNDQCVDFLLIELLKCYKKSQIVSFYQPKNHYKMLLNGLDIQVNILTIFNNENIVYDSDVCVIDDYYTAKKYIEQQETECSKVVKIYRSNTFLERDLYQSDINIIVSGLPSGNSALLDGLITIFDREKTYAEFKYKIKAKTVFLYH